MTTNTSFKFESIRTELYEEEKGEELLVKDLPALPYKKDPSQDNGCLIRLYNNETQVIKIYTKVKGKIAVDQCENEFLLVKNIKSPFIINFFKVIKLIKENKKVISGITMEYVHVENLCSLDDIIKAEESTWTKIDLALFSAALIHSLCQLHCLILPILHHDIKPGNIAVYKDGDHYWPKIIDFTISLHKDEAGTMKYLTVQYYDQNKTATCESDTRALGQSLLELFMKKTECQTLFKTVFHDMANNNKLKIPQITDLLDIFVEPDKFKEKNKLKTGGNWLNEEEVDAYFKEIEKLNISMKYMKEFEAIAPKLFGNSYKHFMFKMFHQMNYEYNPDHFKEYQNKIIKIYNENIPNTTNDYQELMKKIIDYHITINAFCLPEYLKSINEYHCKYLYNIETEGYYKFYQILFNLDHSNYNSLNVFFDSIYFLYRSITPELDSLLKKFFQNNYERKFGLLLKQNCSSKKKINKYIKNAYKFLIYFFRSKIITEKKLKQKQKEYLSKPNDLILDEDKPTNQKEEEENPEKKNGILFLLPIMYESPELSMKEYVSYISDQKKNDGINDRIKTAFQNQSGEVCKQYYFEIMKLKKVDDEFLQDFKNIYGHDYGYVLCSILCFYFSSADFKSKKFRREIDKYGNYIKEIEKKEFIKKLKRINIKEFLNINKIIFNEQMLSQKKCYLCKETRNKILYMKKLLIDNCSEEGVSALSKYLKQIKCEEDEEEEAEDDLHDIPQRGDNFTFDKEKLNKFNKKQTYPFKHNQLDILNYFLYEVFGSYNFVINTLIANKKKNSNIDNINKFVEKIKLIIFTENANNSGNEAEQILNLEHDQLFSKGKMESLACFIENNFNRSDKLVFKIKSLCFTDDDILSMFNANYGNIHIYIEGEPAKVNDIVYLLRHIDFPYITNFDYSNFKFICPNKKLIDIENINILIETKLIDSFISALVYLSSLDQNKLLQMELNESMIYINSKFEIILLPIKVEINEKLYSKVAEIIKFIYSIKYRKGKNGKYFKNLEIGNDVENAENEKCTITFDMENVKNKIEEIKHMYQSFYYFDIYKKVLGLNYLKEMIYYRHIFQLNDVIDILEKMKEKENILKYLNKLLLFLYIGSPVYNFIFFKNIIFSKSMGDKQKIMEIYKKINNIIPNDQLSNSQNNITTETFTTVSAVKYKDELFAKKVLSEEKIQMIFGREIIWSSLLPESDHIIRYYGQCEDGILMDFYNMSLRDFILGKCDERFNCHIVFIIIFQIIQAIKFIHDNDVYHGHLTPSNIFLKWSPETGGDIPPHIMIGLTTESEENCNLNDASIKNEKSEYYNKEIKEHTKQDVYSLVAIIFELIHKLKGNSKFIDISPHYINKLLTIFKDKGANIPLINDIYENILNESKPYIVVEDNEKLRDEESERIQNWFFEKNLNRECHDKDIYLKNLIQKERVYDILQNFLPPAKKINNTNLISLIHLLISKKDEITYDNNDAVIGYYIKYIIENPADNQFDKNSFLLFGLNRLSKNKIGNFIQNDDNNELFWNNYSKGLFLYVKKELIPNKRYYIVKKIIRFFEEKNKSSLKNIFQLTVFRLYCFLLMVYDNMGDDCVDSEYKREIINDFCFRLNGIRVIYSISKFDESNEKIIEIAQTSFDYCLNDLINYPANFDYNAVNKYFNEIRNDSEFFALLYTKFWDNQNLNEQNKSIVAVIVDTFEQKLDKIDRENPIFCRLFEDVTDLREKGDKRKEYIEKMYNSKVQKITTRQNKKKPKTKQKKKAQDKTIKKPKTKQ